MAARHARLIVPLLVLLAVVAAGRAEAQRDGRVIGGEELTRGGLLHLGELPAYVDGSRFTTLEGFAYSASLNALSLPGTQGWQLFVDGRRVDVRVWDAARPGVLGLPVAAIDSVVVNDLPHLHEGHWVQGGALHVWTRQPEAGWSAETSVAMQGEVGDPGPFRYTAPEDETPDNVDSNGPYAGLQWMRSTAEWSLGVRGQHVDHFVSDAALQPLWSMMLPPERSAKTRATSLRLEASREKGRLRQQAAASAGRTEDFFFVQEIARMVPSLHHHAQADWRGEMQMGRTRRVYARAGGVVHRLGRLYEASPVALDWQERRAWGAIGGAWDHAAGSLEMSVSGVAERAQAVLGTTNRWSASAFVDAARNRGAWTLRSGGALATDGAAFAPRLYVQTRWRSGRHRLMAHGSLSSMLPGEEARAAYWTRLGQHPLQSAAPAVTAAQRGSRATVDAHWHWDLVPSSFHLETYGQYRRFAHVPVREAVLPDSGADAATATYGSTAIGGTLWGAGLRGRAFALGAWQRLHYSVVRPAGSGETFQRVWDAVPAHRLDLHVVWPAAPGFAVHGRVLAQSATHWTASADDRDARRRVDGGIRLDLGADKELADGLVWMSLSVENLLNHELRYHLLGAQFNTALRVQLRMRLDG